MSNTDQLQRNGEVVTLHGRINFQTVTELHKQLGHALVPGVTQLDCSQVEQCDSSVISLLLAGLRYAQSRQISLQLKGMNQQILSLARLYDVEPILLTTPA